MVQIVKHEWPRNWPTFISDIVGASKTNKSLCQNNMAILKLLRYALRYATISELHSSLSCSEEVFDFSSGQMTQVKAKHLKDSMCSEFSQIFQLCIFVMVSTTASHTVTHTTVLCLLLLRRTPRAYH